MNEWVRLSCDGLAVLFLVGFGLWEVYSEEKRINYHLMNAMKRLAMAVFLAVATVSVGVIAHAENPEHMRQLLSTGDCPHCDLSGASLEQLDLTGANLMGANLSNARFSDVQLVSANLEDADLSDTFFRSSDLTGANLKNADLSNMSSFFICNGLSAYSYGEEVSQADIDDCVTQLVTFRVFVDLCDQDSEIFDLLEDMIEEEQDYWCGSGEYEALLYSSYPAYSQLSRPGLLLRGANLKGVDLTGSDFSGADLSYAVLVDADASTATFDYATLSAADLSGLENADLERAWLNTADMAEWLVAAQLAEEEEARRMGSRLYVGSLNRAQQAYYLEHDEFTKDLSMLGLGLSKLSEYDAFEFGILADERDDVTVQYVLSKDSGFPSSIGVVYLVEVEQDESSQEQLSVVDKAARTKTAICESDMAISITPAELPEVVVVNNVVNCPTGWNHIQ